jgi:hypothetical protein
MNMFKTLLRLLCCIALALFVNGIITSDYGPDNSIAPSTTISLTPIRIALAVDSRSLRDVFVLMESAFNIALHPDELVFHIVFVAATE